MKVTFDKTDDGWQMSEDGGDYLDHTVYIQVKKKLEKLFKSFAEDRSRYDTNHKNAYYPEILYFTFKDREDEDYFTIWSSDGIEI
jgi:hypothetical protein